MSSDRTLAVHQGRALDFRTLAAWTVFLAALATIFGAWGFQLIGNYIPCPLCLAQRIPYYIGVPVALLAVIAAMTGREQATRLLLLAVAGIFVWSAYKGGFHSGVEWGWWQGPTECAGGAGLETREGGNLLDRLNEGTTVVSCTEAAWRFPNAEWGLSFAGWNAVISTGIALAALFGAALPGSRRAHGSSSVSQ
jgi:disulfide bond formation protein DsbB